MTEGEQDRGHVAPGTTVIAPSDVHDASLAARRSEDGAKPPEEARGASPSRPDRREETSSRVGDESKESRPHRRFSALTVLLFLLLLSATGVGTGAAVWAFGEEGRARKAEQEALEKERKAQDEAARFKGRFHQSEATWKAAIQEFRHAQAAAEDARRSEEATKAILDFFKKTLLSAGRPGDGSLPAAFWAGGQGSDVTLRKALDSTESQVAGAFADRPLAEAAIREMLGLGYLNVGEAAQAVQQSERALALREATQGAAHADAAACRNQLAIAYRLANRTTEAGRLFDREPDSTVHASALAARIDAAPREEARRGRAEAARVPDDPPQDPTRRLDDLRHGVDPRRGAPGSEAVRRGRAVAAVGPRRLATPCGRDPARRPAPPHPGDRAPGEAL